MKTIPPAYVKIRKENPFLPAKYALADARFSALKPNLKWKNPGNHFACADTQEDGFSIRINVDIDEYYDIYEGTDTVSERFGPKQYFRNPGNPRGGSREYKYVLPYADTETYTWESTFGNYRLCGASKGTATDLAREEIRKKISDCVNDRETVLCFTITATKNGIELGTASFGGYGPSYPYGDSLYVEIEREAGDLISEAVSEAQAALKILCGCKEAV